MAFRPRCSFFLVALSLTHTLTRSHLDPIAEVGGQCGCELHARLFRRVDCPSSSTPFDQDRNREEQDLGYHQVQLWRASACRRLDHAQDFYPRSLSSDGYNSFRPQLQYGRLDRCCYCLAVHDFPTQPFLGVECDSGHDLGCDFATRSGFLGLVVVRHGRESGSEMGPGRIRDLWNVAFAHALLHLLAIEYLYDGHGSHAHRINQPPSLIIYRDILFYFF